MPVFYITVNIKTNVILGISYYPVEIRVRWECAAVGKELFLLLVFWYYTVYWLLYPPQGGSNVMGFFIDFCEGQETGSNKMCVSWIAHAGKMFVILHIGRNMKATD